jgi:hypothetical protein
LDAGYLTTTPGVRGSLFYNDPDDDPVGIASFDCSSAAAVVAQEASFYSPQARISACVIPGSGHDLSLSLNHRLQALDAVA